MALASNALIDRTYFKQYADDQISVSENDDAIENIINAKTEEFHKYCEITQFKSRQYTEYYDGNGGGFLYPRNLPIISISSIHDSAEWDFTADTLIDSDLYRSVDGRYVALQPTAPRFVQSTQNIKIVYTAGYANIPEDVKLACVREVVREFQNRRHPDVSNINLDDGTIAFVEKGLLKSTKEVLDQYRLLGVV